MKKTITLYKATRLKDELERVIKEDNTRIKLLSKQSDKKDEINEIQQLKADKDNLRIQLTVAIAEQNLKIGKGEKSPNQYYIKFRSGRVEEKKLQQDLNAETKIIKELDKEINELDNKLSIFNLSHKVKLEASQEVLDSITTNLD